MGRICAIGERGLVEGYGLAGALLSVAEDAPAARTAWRSLPADVTLVILTPSAAEAVARERPATDGRLVVILP